MLQSRLLAKKGNLCDYVEIDDLVDVSGEGLADLYAFLGKHPALLYINKLE